jgi:hypothetical protein
MANRLKLSQSLTLEANVGWSSERFLDLKKNNRLLDAKALENEFRGLSQTVETIWLSAAFGERMTTKSYFKPLIT